MSSTMPPKVGSDFGDYRIDAHLGRGAMGVVYRAWQRRMNRAVALKVLPADLAEDPVYRARFVREAGALAQLDSPHVVQIYDHGELGGHLYLAMQLVAGPDLGRVLEAGPLPPRRALLIAGQVAAALGDGHAAGVVHRDVKPGNVLLRPRSDHDEDDFAYLCDFGIARSTAADLATGPRTDGIIGTLGYLAPERLHGRPAVPASDVYSWGCLLWALLTGAAPYGGSQPEVIMGHLDAPVPQLRGADQRTRRVNALLAAVLAKDPGDRPAIPEVRSRVRAILAPGGGATPLPRALPATRPRPVRRSRLRWALLGAAVAIAVAAAAWVLLISPSATAASRLARSTPVGVACSETAVPDGAAAAGALRQLVCSGTGVGDLRLIAVTTADDATLARLAGTERAAVGDGECPRDLPARTSWERDGRRGTLVCVVQGLNTRYAWTVDGQDVVGILDGSPQAAYPRDVDAVAACFAGLHYA